MSKIVKDILSNYQSESPGVLTNLYRILMNGRLSGTGKILILPVDQGFEHGPLRSFAVNPDSYDPNYHYKLAIEAKMSAYAAPLGFLEAGASLFAGQIPTILKLNSNNSLTPKSDQPDQAFTSSVDDALRLGCSGVGITIYPGSSRFLSMISEAKDVIKEAKSRGLAVIVWSYPRGAGISKEGESAIDICAYAAHIAALIGANIIKVKLPSPFIEQTESRKIYESEKIDISTKEARVRHIMQSCFNGSRIVLFSGGSKKSEDEILSEVEAIRLGGGSGSIIGRNSFQPKYHEALKLLSKISDIYAK